MTSIGFKVSSLRASSAPRSSRATAMALAWPQRLRWRWWPPEDPLKTSKAPLRHLHDIYILEIYYIHIYYNIYIYMYYSISNILHILLYIVIYITCLRFLCLLFASLGLGVHHPRGRGHRRGRRRAAAVGAGPGLAVGRAPHHARHPDLRPLHGRGEKQRDIINRTYT